MFANLRKRISDAIGKGLDELPYDQPLPEPVVKNGIAKISDPEQIPEIYCKVVSKDHGEQYIGLKSGVVYIMAHPWEVNE